MARGHSPRLVGGRRAPARWPSAPSRGRTLPSGPDRVSRSERGAPSVKIQPGGPLPAIPERGRAILDRLSRSCVAGAGGMRPAWSLHEQAGAWEPENGSPGPAPAALRSASTIVGASAGRCMSIGPDCAPVDHASWHRSAAPGAEAAGMGWRCS